MNPDHDSLYLDCRRLADQAKTASRILRTAPIEARDGWFSRVSGELVRRSAEIFAANESDVAEGPSLGLNDAAIDRLRLDPKRIRGIAAEVASVGRLPEVIGESVRSSLRPNGLLATQIRVPLGVIFMIFESRPNVTVDAASLSLKSGNAAILRGGKEAIRTNRALHAILADALEECGLPRSAVQLVETTDRAAVGHLLGMDDRIDLAIPRGGEGLIRRVVAEAKMPVLKHYKGVCHIYIDADVDVEQAASIVVNAKARRPGVCNAVETLLVHKGAAPVALPRVCQALIAEGVALRGDPASRSIVSSMTHATEEDWDAEYLEKILSVAVVDSIDAAISHIDRHGSGHTEAILSRNPGAIARFLAEVDSSAVIANASTRFNDGGELGLGSEIGISTDKIHARGPCGLRELTTTKWVVVGTGQIRE